MVCDLQGVYNSDMIPPVFELTDPAIHYKSKSGKSNVFGRTDAGEAGMDLFFKTHRCSQVCKWMQLSRKLKNWHKLESYGCSKMIAQRFFKKLLQLSVA